MCYLSYYKRKPIQDFVLSGTSTLSDLLNLSIIRVFGGVSAILSHQIKNLREYTKDVGDIKCSESQCIIVEIFFVIDTNAKLNNGKTTDQSLRKGNHDNTNNKASRTVSDRAPCLPPNPALESSIQLMSYHMKGFELLQEDLSALLVENYRESRQSSRENRVYPTTRQNQSIPGRNVLVFVYIVAIMSVLSWR